MKVKERLDSWYKDLIDLVDYYAETGEENHYKSILEYAKDLPGVIKEIFGKRKCSVYIAGIKSLHEATMIVATLQRDGYIAYFEKYSIGTSRYDGKKIWKYRVMHRRKYEVK